MLAAVFSALIWTFIGLVTLVQGIVWLVPVVASLAVDRRRRALPHFAGALWARTLRLLHPAWGITRVGVRELREARRRGEGPYVIVANHQSTIDIAALYQLPLNFKWISKASNFRIPMLGWYMHMAGYIPLDRADKSSMVRCMARARKWLERGASVAFFPEGTRSPDGELLPFKLGAFKLAIATGCPVLPVTLAGTRQVLPRGSWKIPARAKSTIWVDAPIPTTGLAADAAEDLARQVKELIAARLLQSSS